MSFCQPLAPRQKLAWADAVRRCRALTSSARLVAAELVAHHNTETGQLNPSVDRLAAVLGLAARTVKAALAELLAAGWIARRLTGRSPLYRLERVEVVAPAERPAGVQKMHLREAGKRTSEGAKSPPKPSNQPVKEPGAADPSAAPAEERPAAVSPLDALRASLSRAGDVGALAWLRGVEAVAGDGGVLLRAPRSALAWLSQEAEGGALARAARAAGLGRVRVSLAG